MRSIFILLLVGIVQLTPGSNLYAGEKGKEDDVLFTFGNTKVVKSEFSYIYDKNNIGKASSYSENSLKEYLELYINFRLKVKQAEEMGIDTLSAIKAELATYRSQLAQSYMSDKEMIEQMVKEAYDRSKSEIKASHILITLASNATPKDTMEAYKKIMKIRKRVVKGGDFGKVAMETSQDPSVKENKGSLGYFSVLQMVYAFETVAYNTPVGKVSKPVRTQFGYHLVKVTDIRPARGEIEVAHIFVRVNRSALKDKQEEAKQKIDQLNILVKSQSFEKVAMGKSEDKASAKKGGKLPWFGVGKMVPEFEEAAFTLKKDGDISKPVRTEFGWHLIKRLKIRSIQSYEEVRNDLRRKIQRDVRSKLVSERLLERIKKEYNFVEYKEEKEQILKRMDSSIITMNYKYKPFMGAYNPLMKLGSKTIYGAEFGKYLEAHSNRRIKGGIKQVFDKQYDEFVKETCLKYEEDQLEIKYPDFKALMGEYRDGILLFELTDREVWSRAVEDSSGLAEYHAKHRAQYIWGDRVRAEIFTCANQEIADQCRKMARKNKKAEAIVATVNKDAKGSVSMEEGTFEKEQHPVIDQIIWKLGLSSNIVNDDKSVSFARITGLFEPVEKSLSEAKGYIVADYQEYLEKAWIESLRAKYPVEVNEDVFKSLVH